VVQRARGAALLLALQVGQGLVERAQRRGLDDRIAEVVDEPEAGVARAQQRLQARAPGLQRPVVGADLAGDVQQRPRGRAQRRRAGEDGRAVLAGVAGDQPQAGGPAQRAGLGHRRVQAGQRRRAQLGVLQLNRGRQAATAQLVRVGAQVGEARGVLLDGQQPQARARRVQRRQRGAMAGAGDHREVAVVQHGGQGSGQALVQLVFALQRRQRMGGGQADARRARAQHLVVGVRRRHAARRRGARGSLGQQPLHAVGHRRPRELAGLHAAARDEFGTDLGALHELQQLEHLALLVLAEVDVERGRAAHLGQRRGARGDCRALAGHRLEHRQAEALVARRIDQRDGAGVGATQVQVVQQHHVHLGVAGQCTALRVELAAAGAHDRVVPALVAEAGEAGEEQRRVLVAGARARGHEVRARDAVAALEVGHLVRRGRREVAAGVVHLDVHRASGEALEVARRALRDRCELLRVLEGQRLLLPHRVVHVRAENLGDHVVHHAHRRGGERIAVVAGDERRGAHLVTDLLDDAAIAVEVGVVQRGGVVVADAGHARRRARAVDHHQPAAELRRRPQAQQRHPHAGDAGAAELEEDAVDDDGRLRSGHGGFRRPGGRCRSSCR
jgi:DNA-directed RNA polymerase subunit K/omega